MTRRTRPLDEFDTLNHLRRHLKGYHHSTAQRMIAYLSAWNEARDKSVMVTDPNYTVATPNTYTVTLPLAAEK